MTPRILCVLLVASAAANTHAEESFKTVIRADQGSDESQSTDGERELSLTPEEGLERQGQQLVRSGGPLSKSRLFRRGFEGARQRATLFGLQLNDPLSGSVDVAALPFGAFDFMQSGRGFEGLKLTREARQSDGFLLRLSAGSFGTYKGLAALDLVDDTSRFLVAVHAGSTLGNYRYSLRTQTGGSFENQTRTNNEQMRAGAALLYETQWRALKPRLVARADAHSGGIPGFATQPTNNLRAHDTNFGFSLGSDLDSTLQNISISLQGSRNLRRSSDQHERSLSSLTPALSFLVAQNFAIGDRTLSISSPIEFRITRALEPDVSRTEFALPLHAALDINADLSAEAHVGARFVSDQATLFSGGLLFRLVRPHYALRASLSRDTRPPSLYEKYAPQGLVLPNPGLENESTNDAEVALRFGLSRRVRFEIAAFAGIFENAILYVNRNAFDVVASNTGPGFRAGGEFSMRVQAHDFVRFESSGGVLRSRLDASGARLPLSPEAYFKSAIDLGPRDSRVQLRFFQRGKSSADIFGVREAPTYGRVDLSYALSTAEGYALQVGCDNVTNVQAQDANLFPLAGRTFYLSLSVQK